MKAPKCHLLIALACAGVAAARPAALAKAAALGPDASLSHVRAVACYCERQPAPESAKALAATPITLFSLPTT